VPAATTVAYTGAVLDAQRQGFINLNGTVWTITGTFTSPLQATITNGGGVLAPGTIPGTVG